MSYVEVRLTEGWIRGIIGGAPALATKTRDNVMIHKPSESHTFYLRVIDHLCDFRTWLLQSLGVNLYCAIYTDFTWK